MSITIETEALKNKIKEGEKFGEYHGIDDALTGVLSLFEEKYNYVPYRIEDHPLFMRIKSKIEEIKGGRNERA